VTTRSGFESGYAPSDGSKILLWKAQAPGPTVVFIHAGVSDRRMWDPQFDFFARKFRVVRYDLRGFGKSEMPDLPYSNRDDLGNVLLHLKIDKAALIRMLDWAGRPQSISPLEHPERVTALVAGRRGASVDGTEWSDEGIRLFHRVHGGSQKKATIERAREMDAVLWLDDLRATLRESIHPIGDVRGRFTKIISRSHCLRILNRNSSPPRLEGSARSIVPPSSSWATQIRQS